MNKSKVIRDNGRHITRVDYKETSLLSTENVTLPKVGSLQSRVLRRLFPTGKTLSHREIDFITCSYRLGGYVGSLRDKGWVIVIHDEAVKTKDIVPRQVVFTRYELFANFTSGLQERITLFCEVVDKFESEAAATASDNKAA